MPDQTLVWVANRDNPINDTSGLISITPHGNLQLHTNHTNSPIWFTNNVSLTHSNNTMITAQLTDTGNLILTHRNNPEAIVWQSFDHPTDTFLSFSKIGFNRKTGQSWFLQSWKSDDDPGIGSFMLNFSTSEKPELFLFKQNLKLWRGGSFNGEIFTGVPNYKGVLNTFNVSFLDQDNRVELTYNALNKSTIRALVLPTGSYEAHVWDYQNNQWNRFWSAPNLQCDNYGTCGSNSNCDVFQCSCLPGFEPKSKQDWYENRDTSGGCARRKNNGVSICGKGEGFIKVESVKIPDTSIATADMDLSLQECEVKCLRNCSCTAYAAADVRNGGSGCLAWYGDLMDVQLLSQQGQDLYVRVDAIELASYAGKSKRNVVGKRILTVSMVSIATIALLIAFCACCIWKKKRTERDTMTQHLNQDSPTQDEDDESSTNPNLPFFHFEIIMEATNRFGGENELGQGGFGSVYKGILSNGQEIAVKRLSKCSGQGTQEFKNEIKLIARLQHRNLVRLLGYCIHKEERMLIYEYLSNKSLDFFIFASLPDTSRQTRFFMNARNT